MSLARNGRGPVVLVAAAGVLLCAPQAGAGGIETVAKQLYLRYCSACHGSDGKGDGVVSGLMTPKPTDLTQMAKDAGGEFPYLRTMQAIDGRVTIRAHGEPDMPVWGEIFSDRGGAQLERRLEVQGKLMLITEHLRSIQEATDE